MPVLIAPFGALFPLLFTELIYGINPIYDNYFVDLWHKWTIYDNYFVDLWHKWRFMIIILLIYGINGRLREITAS